MPGFGCSPGSQKQQHPSSECTWKRPSISNIATLWASPGFKAAIVHIGGLDIRANVCPEALRTEQGLEMWWLVPVDRENRDIFCVSGSLLRRWHCFEFANRVTEEKMVVGRSRGVPRISSANGNSVVLE